MVTAQDKDFYAFLQEHHTGEANAITSKDLRSWGKGPEIRKMSHRLRVEGYPICFSRNGIFVAANSDELRRTIRHVQAFIRSLSKVEKGLIEVYNEYLIDMR